VSEPAVTVAFDGAVRRWLRDLATSWICSSSGALGPGTIVSVRGSDHSPGRRSPMSQVASNESSFSTRTRRSGRSRIGLAEGFGLVEVQRWCGGQARRNGRTADSSGYALTRQCRPGRAIVLALNGSQPRNPDRASAALATMSRDGMPIVARRWPESVGLGVRRIWPSGVTGIQLRSVSSQL
jgi:hypothetical protein